MKNLGDITKISGYNKEPSKEVEMSEKKILDVTC